MSAISSAHLLTMKNFTSTLNQNTPPTCASCHDSRLDNLLTTHLDSSRAHAETKQISDYHISCKQCLVASAHNHSSTEAKTSNIFFTCTQCDEVFETSSATFSQMTQNQSEIKTSSFISFYPDTHTLATRSFINAYQKGAPIHYDNFFI